jgi:sigma-B regulation protein RsbU (phosphoserine phosphatase)
MGIVTADISLSWLQEMVASLKIGKTGYGFLITKNGTFVTHPDSQFIMNETIFSVAEAKGDTGLRKLGREMIKGKSGFVPFRSMVTGEKCWMVYAPLSASGWQRN